MVGKLSSVMGCIRFGDLDACLVVETRSGRRSRRGSGGLAHRTSPPSAARRSPLRSRIQVGRDSPTCAGMHCGVQIDGVHVRDAE